MKVVLVVLHPGVGSLVPALRLLDERGHDVHLAYETVKSVEAELELEALRQECSRMTVGHLPEERDQGWAAVATWLRSGIDYLRYLEPRYRDAPKLRARAERQAPRAVLRAGRLAHALGPPAVAVLKRALQDVERCVPPSASARRFLTDQAPDVLLLAHLIEIGPTHADYLRAAKRLGVRSAFPVRGWDNLTNKGLLRDEPDLVLVWNDLQAAEAKELHRVAADRIAVTGAPSCDHWFEWDPSRSREEFCRAVGLRPDRPILLYVCSSGFVAPDEVAFVRSWIDRLRSRGGRLAEAGYLVRPHPLNAAQWAGAGLDGPQVAVWPRFGEAPHDEASRRNFFDSIYHAAAVVGINTTVQIESAIVGRPVHTLLAEEFRDTQQGTLHFHHLRAEEFGHLHVARTFEEHAAQLEASLAAGPDAARNERFLRRFVRPGGLDRSATEQLVEAIEELAARPAPAPDPGPALGPLVRFALRPAAARAGRSRVGAAAPTPLYEARQAARRVLKDRGGAPVVAAPWADDEIGELLYWVPYLRRLCVNPRVRERLFVVRRRDAAERYAGIGAGQVDLEELLAAVPDVPRPPIAERELQGPLRAAVADAFDLGSRAVRVLEPGPVAAARAELAATEPARRPEERLLAPAPLARLPLSAGLALPDRFVAVALAFGTGLPDTPEHRRLATSAVAVLAERIPVVVVEAPPSLAAELADAGAELPELHPRDRDALLGRARAFAGSSGASACLSVLLGVPAALLRAGAGADGPDLRLLASLETPPFGRLRVLDADQVDGATAAAEILDLVAGQELAPVPLDGPDAKVAGMSHAPDPAAG